MFKTNMENEKNYVTSHYAETYTTIAKRSTASQRHYNKFRDGVALISLSTDPDGIRAASGRRLDGSDGSGWFQMAFSRTPPDFV